MVGLVRSAIAIEVGQALGHLQGLPLIPEGDRLDPHQGIGAITAILIGPGVNHLNNGAIGARDVIHPIDGHRLTCSYRGDRIAAG